MALKLPSYDYCESLIVRQDRSKLDKLIARVYALPYLEFGEQGTVGALEASLRAVVNELNGSFPQTSRKLATQMALMMTYAAVSSIRYYFPEDEPKFLSTILALETYLKDGNPALPDPNVVFPEIASKGGYGPAIHTFAIPYQSLKIPDAPDPMQILCWVLENALLDEGLSTVPQHQRRNFNWWLSEVIPHAVKGSFPKYLCTFQGIVEFTSWREDVLGS